MIIYKIVCFKIVPNLLFRWQNRFTPYYDVEWENIEQINRYLEKNANLTNI
jgi:hypothetical protein